MNLSELQQAIEYGIIDIDNLKTEMKMAKRKEYLEKHNHRIWQGKDGRWITYLPDDTKPKGRRQICAYTREKLEDKIIEFWKEQEKKSKPCTFADTYNLWRESKDKEVSENTVKKYASDYKRYFEGTEFEALDIRKITDEDVKDFMIDTIKQYNLQRESMRKCFGYITNTFMKAGKEKIIAENPIKFMESKDFNRWCCDRYVPDSEKIISQEDMMKLQQQFKKDHEKMPWYIPTYAVEFASLTGMRVGEIVAIKWEDVLEDRIIICRSEKYNPEKNKYWIDATKNGKCRIFPLTEEIIGLLREIHRIEEEYGFLCEWVFANQNGRIHAPTVSNCAKTKCRQLGLSYKGKGIHGYRKTLNSAMRHNGTSTVVAASIMGHTPAVNEKYYTYDIADIEEKKAIVEKANKMIRVVEL